MVLFTKNGKKYRISFLFFAGYAVTASLIHPHYCAAFLSSYSRGPQVINQLHRSNIKSTVPISAHKIKSQTVLHIFNKNNNNNNNNNNDNQQRESFGSYKQRRAMVNIALKTVVDRTSKRTTKQDLHRLSSSSMTNENHEPDTTVIPLKEDEEFISAVNDVKEAAKNVTTSSVQFTSAIVSKGPGIVWRLFSTVVRKPIRDDFQRRRKHYISDWIDAFDNIQQCIPAIFFLYFSCLAPVVSFGTIAFQITEGTIGVAEFLIGSGGAGMLYSILSGQPMTFIAPTGLSLAFISGLYRFCSIKGFQFLPIYTWVGLWTSLFMAGMGFCGTSKLIRYCTRFTDEVFNGLLSINFIYEGFSSLRRNFLLADPLNLSMPFVSLSIALGTYWSTAQAIAQEKSIYFSSKIRKIVKDFGPVAVLVGFSALNKLNFVKKFGVPTLSVPETFELAGGRKFMVNFMSVPVKNRWLCALPATLLTALFFMDQNISARIVNKEDNKLQKGEAYNIDMVALGIITSVLSILGLPWMCGATVQSLNHVRAMTSLKFNNETEAMEIDHIIETRTTGFITHAMLAATIYLLPVLTFLPIPVVSGVFLFLGRKLMTGNTFFQRIIQSVAEKDRLPANHPINILGRKKMNLFTGIQILCLAGLWTFKQNSAISIFFPSVIGLLMVIRRFILPKVFSEEELIALGDQTPVK